MLSRRDLNRALLARQMLLERSTIDAPAAIEALVGLQAQSPLTPYVALWSRLAGFDPDVVSDGLERRRLVRMTLMRGTIHLVTARDGLRLRPLVDPLLVRSTGGALGRRLAGVDLDELAEAGRELLEAAPLTTNEIGGGLARRWPDHDPIDLARGVHRLVPCVQIPPRGLWGRTGPAAFTTIGSWLGKPTAARPSLPDLVLRFLRAFGPATLADVRTWSGLTGLTAAADRLGDRVVHLTDDTGRDLLDATGGLLPDGDAPAPVRFLPEFDNLWLSHADRTRVLPAEHVARVLPTIASGRPLVLVDGFIAGAWRVARTRKDATLHIEPFARVTKPQRKELSEEGERLLAFVAPDLAGGVAIS